MPLVALWLVLRFVFDVPIAIITIVLTVLAVVTVVVWNRHARRSQEARRDVDR